MSQQLTLEEYRLLVERAPIMIWRSNLTMECDYFNEIWLAFTGRTLAQESGNGWAEGVHPDDFARCLEIYTGHFARRQAFEMEYRLKRHDGAYRWIFDRGVPFTNDAGEFRGYIGSCIDVTDRVEAQAALKKAHDDEIRQLQDIIPICMYCKKVRDDQNYWQQVETYIGSLSKAPLSHGVCPTCTARLFADMGLADNPSPLTRTTP